MIPNFVCIVEYKKLVTSKMTLTAICDPKRVQTLREVKEKILQIVLKMAHFVHMGKQIQVLKISAASKEYLAIHMG